MKFAVVVFPGSNCDHDAYHAAKHVLGQEREFVWHKETDLEGADVVILPGGFAHGDYLRTGAIARFSPVMEAVAAFAAAGGPVIGICNGFQVLLEAGLLEGAMLRNRDSNTAASTCASASSRPTRRSPALCQPGQMLRIPIAHGEGNYYAEPDVLERLEQQRPGHLPLRRRDAARRPTSRTRTARCTTSPASATRARNVVGLMPHPERACESVLGSADGLVMLESVVASMKKRRAGGGRR